MKSYYYLTGMKYIEQDFTTQNNMQVVPTIENENKMVNEKKR